MPSPTRLNNYNALCAELATYVAPRIHEVERILATICLAMGPRHHVAPFSFAEGWIARATPWSRRCGLVVTSERVLLVEWSKLQPRFPRRIVLEAPRAEVAVTRCTAGRKSAALELSSGDGHVRLYLYDRPAESAQAVEVALPRVTASRTTAKKTIAPPKPVPRATASSRKRRARRQRKGTDVVINLPSDLPLDTRSDWRRRAREGTRQPDANAVPDRTEPTD